MITSETFRSQYSGNDVATSFAYGFPVTNKAHVLVVRTSAAGVDTTLTVDVDYTVNGVSNPSSAAWTITYPISGTPLATGARLTITPGLPLKQLTDFNNQGGFFAKNHEDAFDYLTLLSQQNLEILNRCIRLPVGTTEDALLVLTSLNASVAATAASAATALTNATTAATSASAAQAAAAVLGVLGLRSLALTNANVSLTAGTDKMLQLLSGALSGPVVINLVRAGAVEGSSFRVRLNGLAVGAANTLTFQENGAGSLQVFNTAGSLTGNLTFIYTGAAWVLFEAGVDLI